MFIILYCFLKNPYINLFFLMLNFKNRLPDFMKVVDPSKQEVVKTCEKRFYEEIYWKIEDLKNKIESSSSYGNFLIFEDKLIKLQKELLVLDNLVVDDHLVDVFEGIKDILKRNLAKCVKLVNSKKSLHTVNLKEQRGRSKYNPAIVENQVRDESSRTGGSGFGYGQKQLEMIERENKQIMWGDNYQMTKRKLLQIDQLQKAINEHLIVQEERIDSVCSITGDSQKTYKSINQMNFYTGGSFFRKFLFVLILSICFALVYSHLHHNRFK